MENDRKTWTKSALPVRYLILDGTFTDPLHGLLVGGGGTILRTRDGGLTWNHSMLTDGGEKTKLTSVFFADQKNGWTVGGQGKIYFTNDGGKFWRIQISNVKENLSDVYFIDAMEGFATGENGVILHTTTAGATWKIEETGSKHKLEKVFFAGKKGFAVGFGGTIMMYDPLK